MSDGDSPDEANGPKEANGTAEAHSPAEAPGPKEAHGPEVLDLEFIHPEQLAAQVNASFATGPVLLALDFDGTLAELQDDPEQSHLVPLAQQELARISAEFAGAALSTSQSTSPGTSPGTSHTSAHRAAPKFQNRIALVSGRDLETLSRLAAVPVGTVLVGSHGAERGLLGADGLELTAASRTEADDALWQELRQQFSQIAAQAEGAWVEEKSYAVVLHTRLVTETVAGKTPEELISAGAAAAVTLGVDPLLGKNVLEAPLRQADKGTALQDLRAELGTQTVLYAGDDVTDEHAFAALNSADFTVKVGGGDTAARFRLRSPEAIAQFLARISLSET